MDTLSSFPIFFSASGTLKTVIVRILNSKRNHILFEVHMKELWTNDYGEIVHIYIAKMPIINTTITPDIQI